MAALTLLETSGLSRHFGGIRAVDNVDFALEPGGLRAIIGPNGAGKTTLTSLICGRIPATSGDVYFNGTNISRLPAHKRIAKGMAYTFQITSIFKDMTAYDNVMFAAQRVERGSTAALKYTAKNALELVGMDPYRYRIAGDLSYGHQRLLEIAMGFVQRPQLLILDEPTQGLAAGEIEDFLYLIRDLSRDMTILLIEHNMDVVMALADKITVMDQGRIIAEGTPEEVRNNAAAQEAYLGG